MDGDRFGLQDEQHEHGCMDGGGNKKNDIGIMCGPEALRKVA
jgi:hypothetical protein